MYSPLRRDWLLLVSGDRSGEAGREVKELYGNDDYDVGGVGYSRKRKVITGDTKRLNEEFYWAVKPPSTLNTEPWQRLESGEAKK